jgi:predicted oxidoreductase (fatty acid repression mutant protein)
VADEKILERIRQAVKYPPTSFNSQTGRAVLLLNEHHHKLWDLTEGALRKVVPPEDFVSTAGKIASFRNGYGTILFFEDQTIVANLQKQFPLYQDNFPVWSQQSSGILQYIVWTALELEGLGASLQHTIRSSTTR